MAKNDQKHVRGEIDKQGKVSQGGLDQLKNQIGSQRKGFMFDYNNARDQGFAEHDEIMGNYRNFLDNFERGSESDAMKRSMGNMEGLAATGGFSGTDIADMRARAIAPTRGIYANAMDSVGRQRTLQGGYSPNYTAAMSKMARDLSSQLSDANVNANASIAEMIQRGKIAGAQGFSSQATAQAGMHGQEDQTKLSANNAMQAMFQAQPGMAKMFADLVMGSSGQQIDLQQLQQALSQMMIQGRLGEASVPGNFQQAMGNIGSVLNLASPISLLGGRDSKTH